MEKHMGIYSRILFCHDTHSNTKKLEKFKFKLNLKRYDGALFTKLYNLTSNSVEGSKVTEAVFFKGNRFQLNVTINFKKWRKMNYSRQKSTCTQEIF